MAIFHLSVKPVQRSKGRSATAAAAYRSGEQIADERTGELHDYRRRSGVEHTELVGWDGSRAELWNAAEKAERRKDGTTAREYEIALPRELGKSEQLQLARDYAQYLNERHGVAVDIAIHDHDGEQPHAHMLATTRQVGSDGRSLEGKAAVEWSDRKRKQHGLEGRKTELAAARETWQDMANAALEKSGQRERIDHRSLEAQRAEALEQGDTERAQALDREPQTKIGWAAQKMERAGFESDRGREQRAREQRNAERQQWYSKARQAGQAVAEYTRELGNRFVSGYQAAAKRLKRWTEGQQQAEQRLREHAQQRQAERQQQRQQTIERRVNERFRQHDRDDNRGLSR